MSAPAPLPRRGGPNRTQRYTNGPAIRAARRDAGLTIDELARRIGIGKAALSAIETEIREASTGVLARLTEELGVQRHPFLRDTRTHKRQGHSGVSGAAA